MSNIKTAQYCRNGHMTNYAPLEHPENNRNFCSECGEPTLLNCPNCQVSIEDLGYMLPKAPKYCRNCGQPFPWTEMALAAAHEFIQSQEQLSEEDRATLDSSIEILAKDTPLTTVRANKVKTILNKAGTGVASMFRDIVVDIMSETAKKIIFPNN